MNKIMVIARMDMKNEFAIKGIHLEGLRKVENLYAMAQNYYSDGIERSTHDEAQEVRNDKIIRDEVVYLVKKYDTVFSKIYFKEFLEYIDTNEDEFWSVDDKYRSSHMFKKVRGEWGLRHTVSKNGADD